MNARHFTTVAIACAFALAASPSAILPAAAAGGSECGWSNVNGRMVFNGTCPHDSSDGSNPQTQPTHCGVSIGADGGVLPAYRMELAVC